MKNQRTPRTLSESSFTVGHPERRPKEHPTSWIILVMFLIALGFVWWTR